MSKCIIHGNSLYTTHNATVCSRSKPRYAYRILNCLKVVYIGLQTINMSRFITTRERAGGRSERERKQERERDSQINEVTERQRVEGELRERQTD